MLYDHDTIKYSIFGAYNYTSANFIELAMTCVYIYIYIYIYIYYSYIMPGV